MTTTAGRAARCLLLEQSFGVLSTISIQAPGYPFGSLTPYSVDYQCRPIIYVSTIAEHTRNLLADPRVSLTVVEAHAGSDDAQSQGRITVLADARPADGREAGVGDRYFRYFHTARRFDEAHDFGFFRLEPLRVRFIGGFGMIHWLAPADFMTANPFSAGEETRILDHMNADHAEALRGYCGGLEAVMTGIDGEGFDVRVSGAKRRFTFDQPVRNMEEARQALIALSRSTP